MSRRIGPVPLVSAVVLVVTLALSSCTSTPEPTPEASTSSTETLEIPADLGDVTVEGTVRLTGDTATLAGIVHNNSPDDLAISGLSCACASGINLGTFDEDGTFVPLSGTLPLAAGGSLSFGGDGELQVQLSGLLPGTVPDAVVPVMAFVVDRNPVQGVAVVTG